MEASDAFAQEIDGSDDPFGKDGFGGEEFGEDTAEEPVRTVDREGNELPAHAPTDGASVESQAGERPAAPEPEQAAPAPAEAAQEATADPGQPPAATDAPQADERAVETEERGQAEAAAEDPTPRAESAGPTEDPTPPTLDSGAARSSATDGEARAEDPQLASSQEPQASADGADEEAPPPDETKDKSGRVTKRRYLLFQVDGPGKLTQVTWYEDKSGKLVPKGTAGSKRQSVCLARGTDEALRFGYAAVGAPQSGVKLVAVAQLHFQPREVKPLPPEPSKQRLQIN